ncbi:MAG: MoxR family ATPase [Myxococcota bacterium]|nr:MoxR family ATPase [Myxococcota bacterium]
MNAVVPNESAFADAATLERALCAAGYLAGESLAVVCWLALTLNRPLLIEGPAGIGKTDLARALAEAMSRRLIRLQCYEGLDEAKALYEWDYAKQILYSQLLRDALAEHTRGAGSLIEAAERVSTADSAFFSRRFLIERPLLQALSSEQPVVMLVDEVDRSDPEFEALLLEVLAESQVTIPEIGPVRAKSAPLFVLTSNGTREMTDALRRRCFHAFVDYPTPAREQAILALHLPGMAAQLAEQLASFARKVRALDLRKTPSVSETIDWARALLLLGANALDRELARSTLCALIKTQEDRETVERTLDSLLDR